MDEKDVTRGVNLDKGEKAGEGENRYFNNFSQDPNADPGGGNTGGQYGPGNANTGNQYGTGSRYSGGYTSPGGYGGNTGNAGNTGYSASQGYGSGNAYPGQNYQNSCNAADRFAALWVL